MEPVRTCVGCRQRGSRSDLLRVIAQNQVLLIDRQASLPGRGAWLHENSKCLEQAITRRAFNRALRESKALDASNLVFA